MSALLDFAQAVGTFIEVIFNFITILVVRFVQSITLLIDLIPRLYGVFDWFPVTFMAIFTLAFGVWLIDRILKLVGLFL